MAKSRPKKPSLKKAGGNPGLIRQLRIAPWKVLKLVIAVATITAIIFLRSLLGNVIFETIGFGLVLGILWLGVIASVIWYGRWRSLARWWNIWLGALLFTLAAWGILSLFYPVGFTVTEVQFGEVSLGGNAGASFIGSQGVGAHPALRLFILFVAGISLTIPYLSISFIHRLVLAIRMAIAAAFAGARWLLPRLRRLLTGIYHRYPVHKTVSIPITGMIKLMSSRQVEAPDMSAKTMPAGTRVADTRDERTAATGIQLPLQPAMDTEEAETWHDSRTAATGAATVEERLPGMDLLEKAVEVKFADADNERRARLIEESLASYGVEAKVVQINPGPSVTQFGIEPGWIRKYKRVVERDPQGKVRLDKDGNPVEKSEEISKTRVKVERITALANNLALALATPNIRIEAPVPGKPVVGIEVPNITTSVVQLRGLMESVAYQRIRVRSKLAMALGNAAGGEPVAADLAKMPHLLIAGTTGSGKTVCINSIITCLLMCNSPNDLRLLLIDPKRVELVSFNGVPHLMAPVVVEVEKAIDTLRRVLREMDNRFSKFAAVGVRNIEGYNASPLVVEPMPYLIVVIDELADLMMSAAEVVEPAICRLAQLSRATGIHLVLATQRPSVDVVTGLIKANFPTRISFAVASAVDSRTILDIGGAEKLLGQGDMLYVPPDASKPRRLRGCFVSDQEIERIVTFWKQRQDIYPSYLEDAVAKAFASLAGEDIKDEDPLLSTARRLVKEHSHLSTSLLQRRLHIGYPRAARIMDTLEEEGTVVRSGDSGSGEIFGTDEEEAE